MQQQVLKFDEVFKIWMDNEVGFAKVREMWLPVAKEKGFDSISEWRLNTALRLGLDKKSWTLETIENPGTMLPEIIIGPYQGWSKFFDNQISTSFKQALEIPEFLEWCKKNNRVVELSRNFPLPTTIILLRKSDGKLIQIEGAHRICAAAFAEKMGQPINFSAQPNSIRAAIAEIAENEIETLRQFLKAGGSKQPSNVQS